MKTGCVYKITNTKNGKCYIGVTTQPIEKRMDQHFGKYSQCTLLKNAIAKHGKDAFEYDIIARNLTEDSLIQREQFWIEFYDSMTPNGYNLVEGGGGLTGYITSDETKQKISDANKGQKRTNEAREKMSNARRGKTPWNKGKRTTEAVRKKLADAKNGKPRTNEAKRKVSEGLKRYWKEKKERDNGSNGDAVH